MDHSDAAEMQRVTQMGDAEAAADGSATNELGLFDLNIEEVLEHWEVEHALREIIANALDEQLLSRTAEIEIFEDQSGCWHIRDHGRGLRIEHFTLNEHPEKTASESQVIGKFGVGLKDALATLHRRGVGVIIRSPYGTFRLREARKHGFDGITTLHVAHEPAPSATGTDVELAGVRAEQIDRAKALFLHFSADDPLEATPYGQVLSRTSGPPRVYIHGVLVNEEPNFLFSYNVTSLTPAMKKRLNRERLNVGRTTYADRIKAIIRAAETDAVCSALADQVGARARGDQCDELQWAEIAQRALNLLHDRRRVTFVTETELEAAPDVINHMRGDGYDVVVVSDAQRTRLEEQYESGDTDLRTFSGYVDEFNASFEYAFVEPGALRTAEQDVYARTAEILALVDISPGAAPPVRISETMRAGPDTTLGVWDRSLGVIVIARTQLGSVEQYAGTLLHEVAHATTGAVDVSRAFESVLTSYIGTLADQRLAGITNTPGADSQPGTLGTRIDHEAHEPNYVTMLVVDQWHELVGALERLELQLLRAGARDRGARIREVITESRRDLQQLARETAARGTEFLQAEEKASRGDRYRPNALLLNGLLLAEPLDPERLPGAVGFAKREPLDLQVPAWEADAAERSYIEAAFERTHAFWKSGFDRSKRIVDAAMEELSGGATRDVSDSERAEVRTSRD